MLNKDASSDDKYHATLNVMNSQVYILTFVNPFYWCG